MRNAPYQQQASTTPNERKRRLLDGCRPETSTVMADGRCSTFGCGPGRAQTTPTPVIRAGGTDVVMMDIRCRVPGEFRGSDIEPQEGCVLGESFAFSPEFVVLPEDYIGVDGRRQDHLLVHASQALDRPSPCQGDVVERHEAEMGSQDATLWACGEEVHGVHAGHVVLVWRRGGVNYLVSAHGHTDVNFRLIERIAQNVEYVSP